MTTRMNVLNTNRMPQNRFWPEQPEQPKTQEEFETDNFSPISSDRCYTVEDIQIILGISRPTVYNLIRQKHFRAIKVGKGYRIPKKSFDAWLDS